MALSSVIHDFRSSLSISYTSCAITALGVWILGLATLAVYRLYFSPLSKFPGPKLAALSKWYEAYYELVCNGKFSREIDRMHDIYGPIVRVTPNELHIKDSQFFDTFYSYPKIQKYGWDAKLGNENAIFTTIHSAVHRRRRGALNPMFSRRAVFNLVPVIREKLELLCKRIDEYEEGHKPVNFTRAYSAMTGDVIMEYFFGFTYKHVEAPEFLSFHEAYMGFALSGHIATQFPWYIPSANKQSAHELYPRLNNHDPGPRVASLIRLKKDQWDLVGRSIAGETTNESSRHTIIDQMLQSDLSPADKSQQHLTDQAQALIAAGIETNSNALSVGTFHIVNTPRISTRLHQELLQAFPSNDRFIPDLLALEKLPYLKACILESFRLSYGIAARNPRVYGDKELRYKEWTIPAGTSVGMTVFDVCHDEAIFPDSHSYIPERWLGNPKTADGESLEHYLVTFGRGPRSCIGVKWLIMDGGSVAWAEVYMTLGTLFRWYKFDLYETDVTDVRYEHDWLMPIPRLDSQGLRLSITKVEN
ncbi:Cytochrome P450 monooxygenase [Lachnellula occidentalis]|uniref:Cytochrome P450 monooxygenase n=1 Tax=Lachnellula occidentalis TaxID=215460 RepID=A0A8H8RDG6_9HELO|nr:Cytochrome P450 monooxygenase [Lachnellula occidentalis]